MLWDRNQPQKQQQQKKPTNDWKLNNMLLNNQWITEEIKEKNQKILRDKWQQRYNNPKPMGHSKSSSERKVYSNANLSQERRKSANDQPNLIPKKIRKGRTVKAQN